MTVYATNSIKRNPICDLSNVLSFGFGCCFGGCLNTIGERMAGLRKGRTNGFAAMPIGDEVERSDLRRLEIVAAA